MISYMISQQLLWYHRCYKNTQYHMILVYDIIFHIIVYVAWYHNSISYVISYTHMVWYWIWYCIWYHIWYHIQYHTWCHIWYQLWYHIQYHTNGMISSLLMSSKEVSNFMWNCGKNPAKTTYFAGLKNKQNVFSCCRDSNPALHTVRRCRLPLDHWPTVWYKKEWMRLYTTSNNSIKSR
jgi:hypothetical protein